MYMNFQLEMVTEKLLGVIDTKITKSTSIKDLETYSKMIVSLSYALDMFKETK